MCGFTWYGMISELLKRHSSNHWGIDWYVYGMWRLSHGKFSPTSACNFAFYTRMISAKRTSIYVRLLATPSLHKTNIHSEINCCPNCCPRALIQAAALPLFLRTWSHPVELLLFSMIVNFWPLTRDTKTSWDCFLALTHYSDNVANQCFLHRNDTCDWHRLCRGQHDVSAVPRTKAWYSDRVDCWMKPRTQSAPIKGAQEEVVESSCSMPLILLVLNRILLRNCLKWLEQLGVLRLKLYLSCQIIRTV